MISFVKYSVFKTKSRCSYFEFNQLVAYVGGFLAAVIPLRIFPTVSRICANKNPRQFVWVLMLSVMLKFLLVSLLLATFCWLLLPWSREVIISFVTSYMLITCKQLFKLKVS